MGALLETSSAEPPARQVFYSGRLDTLYRIFLSNLLLSIATLGVYRFWGRARIRRYLWGAFAFAGDGFEWTGTGGEMFRSFLLAILLLLITFSPYLVVLVSGVRTATALGVALLPAGVILMLLAPLAQYSALRYRLSRTRWRAIRGSLDGSAWAFALRSIGWKLLIPITLGQSQPYSAVDLARYRLNRIGIGTGRMQCTGRGARLHGAWLLTLAAWLLYFLVFILLYVTVLVVVALNDPTTDPVRPEVRQGSWVIGFAYIGGWTVIKSWYQAAFYRHIAQSSELAGLRFHTTLRGRELARFRVVNLIILGGTLGLGLPIIWHRTAKLIASRFAVQGDVDGIAFGQALSSGPKQGEGLLDLLDIGAV